MHDFLLLLPEFILSIGATTILLIGTSREDINTRSFLRWMTVFVSVTAGISLALLPQSAELSNDGWLMTTRLNVVFGVVFIAIVAWTAIAARVPDSNAGEWFSMLLFTAVGMVTLARTAHLAGLFLGIEILSIALYALIAFTYSSGLSLRAGAMYLALAGFASGFLVFGLALVYATYGTMEISQLALQIGQDGMTDWVAIVGFGLFLIGVAFKLAAAPSHMWAAEVYEAAPGPISALIASASKGAVLAAFIPFMFLIPSHWQILWFFAAASMILGNLLALRENRVKRILAYSSIAHIGYVLVGYMAAGQGVGVSGTNAVLFYVVVYALAISGAFITLSMLERESTLTLRDLRGLGRKSPVLAFCMLVFVMSLAGLPPTVGIWGKILLFKASIGANYFWLPLIGLVTTAVGIFYYIRIIVHLFMLPSDASDVRLYDSNLQKGVLVATAVATVLFSIFPQQVMRVLGM